MCVRCNICGEWTTNNETETCNNCKGVSKISTVDLLDSFNYFLGKVAIDFKKGFDEIKKVMEKTMNNEMPDLRTGMAIKLKEDDNFYIITSVSLSNDRVSAINFENALKENGIHFDKIKAIYKYNYCDTGIDMSGKDIEKALIYKKIWKRSELREISKELAESILSEQLGEDIRIVGE